MRFSLIVIAFSFLLGSCHFFVGERITGNGHITSRQKTVGSFNSIDVSGQVIVHVKQDANSSVKLETDENLMSYIETYVSDGTLVIRTKQGFNLDPSKEIIAYVSAPVYKSIELSGQCDIIGDGPIEGTEALGLHASGQGNINLQVSLPKVSAEISGQGNLNLKGQVTDFDAHVSGQGDLKCFDLITDNTSLDISGQSDIEVTVNKKLDVDASGSSTIKYKGTGSIGKQSSSGSSTVERVN